MTLHCSFIEKVLTLHGGLFLDVLVVDVVLALVKEAPASVAKCPMTLFRLYTDSADVVVSLIND